MDLTARTCRPCKGGEPTLPDDRVEALLKEVPSWHRRGDRIERVVQCEDFQEALDHVVAIGEVAEREGHHPDLHIEDYKTLRIELTTHAIGGLSENDLILAAKIDELL